MSSSTGHGYDFGVGLGVAIGSATSSSNHIGQQNQGIAGLVIMLAVLCFIFAYCCWGAPFCRSLCRRRRCCRVDDSDSESGGFASATPYESGRTARRGYGRHGAGGVAGSSATQRDAQGQMMGTPTIILLPHGRMLVVDGTLFTQLQAENTGLDLVELGESVMRAQRNPGITCHQLQNSQGSIIEMDAETPSKDSMGSIACFPPPTYESIYGKEEAGEMPPSYSDILLHRLANLPYEIDIREYARSRDSKEEIEMRSLDNCPHIISNPFSNINYPYNRPSSQSLPRNASLISNPLDAYYVDNETRQQRRRSATTTSRIRRTSCNNMELVRNADDRIEDGRNSRTNSRNEQAAAAAAAAGSENAQDDRFSHHRRDQTPSRLQHHEAPSNPERPSRSNHQQQQQQQETPRRVTVTLENQPVEVNQYLDPNYSADAEESANPAGDYDEAAIDESLANLEALADIRESRV